MKEVAHNDEYYNHPNGIGGYLGGVDLIEIEDIIEKKMQWKS